MLNPISSWVLVLLTKFFKLVTSFDKLGFLLLDTLHERKSVLSLTAPIIPLNKGVTCNSWFTVRIYLYIIPTFMFFFLRYVPISFIFSKKSKHDKSRCNGCSFNILKLNFEYNFCFFGKNNIINSILRFLVERPARYGFKSIFIIPKIDKKYHFF